MTRKPLVILAKVTRRFIPFVILTLALAHQVKKVAPLIASRKAKSLIISSVVSSLTFLQIATNINKWNQVQEELSHNRDHSSATTLVTFFGLLRPRWNLVLIGLLMHAGHLCLNECRDNQSGARPTYPVHSSRNRIRISRYQCPDVLAMRSAVQISGSTQTT